MRRSAALWPQQAMAPPVLRPQVKSPLALREALGEFCRPASRQRRWASTELLIVGAVSGVFALGTACTVGVFVAPFSAAALMVGGGLYPTAIRLPWGVFGAVVLVGWIVGVVW